MISTSGAMLLEKDGCTILKKKLLPLCRIITPNIPESETLLARKLKTVDDLKNAAKEIYDLGPKSVLIKGGHYEGDPIDIFYNGRDFVEFKGKRIVTRHTHGTGCVLSAALAACFARGIDMNTALETARDFLISAIKTAPGLGSGAGPINFFTLPSIFGKLPEGGENGAINRKKEV